MTMTFEQRNQLFRAVKYLKTVMPSNTASYQNADQARAILEKMLDELEDD